MTRAPFSRYGGKYYMLDDILPLLPPHEVWVEAFCGAAWVTLAKQRANVEVINDLDDGVVNFYRVLRDPIQGSSLQALLEMTPYARTEYLHCRDTWRSCTDPVEKARRWYVTVRQSVVGNIGTTGWSYAVGGQPVNRWQRSIEKFADVHERLRFVQIEHQDWRKLLDFWNQRDVLLYCDPPYVHATRGSSTDAYTHEMTDDDHRDLVERLRTFRGRALVSGYTHAIYSPLEHRPWRRIDIDCVAHSTGSTRASTVKQRRVETLWMNYDPAEMHGQIRLPLQIVV